ncbi:MAG: hypothetical protein LBQ43_02325 [Holosporales bacterium]|jgi:hypothetical protein|nr:hypothetical protein [Holosporales bacterium]
MNTQMLCIEDLNYFKCAGIAAVGTFLKASVPTLAFVNFGKKRVVNAVQSENALAPRLVRYRFL